MAWFKAGVKHTALHRTHTLSAGLALPTSWSGSEPGFGTGGSIPGRIPDEVMDLVALAGTLVIRASIVESVLYIVFLVEAV